MTEDGRRFVVCSNAREHGADGYVWEPTPERKGRSRGDGLGAELDIWDKLLKCIPADGVADSYGDVEDRFFERYPDEAAILQSKYGHRWRQGIRSANQFSISAYLAGRLRDLANEDAVRLAWGPAEARGSTTGSLATRREGDKA